MAKLKSFSLIQKFNVVSLLILIIFLVFLGRWISRQIESRVVTRIGHTTSLFAGSVVAPSILEMVSTESTLPGTRIEEILNSSALGDEIVSMKVWDVDGRIIYSTNEEEIGDVFPVEAGLEEAWNGIVSAEISHLDRVEHDVQRQQSDVLLETYTPIREPGTGTIAAVVEFYQRVGAFQNELRAARRQSWVIASSVMLLIYLSLVVLVWGGSRTIVRQRNELQQRVGEYESLLENNRSLHDRLRQAAQRATTLNEQFLRRIAAELHDGPGQDIGYALLTLGRLTEPDCGKELSSEIAADVKSALERSITDVRTISAGLRSPELESLTIREVIEYAARIHHSRAKSRARLSLDTLPDEGTLACKITLFRVLQESLSNSYRHGGDESPEVFAYVKDGYVNLEVVDQGPGITDRDYKGLGIHMGLDVMRERVELLEGDIEILNIEPRGTRVIARIPC